MTQIPGFENMRPKHQKGVTLTPQSTVNRIECAIACAPSAGECPDMESLSVAPCTLNERQYFGYQSVTGECTCMAGSLQLSFASANSASAKVISNAAVYEWGYNVYEIFCKTDA
ncbi:uncharacterized protein LOC125378362 [Haliotis rufescens]|uniref:uncharacterized protein LOC125378362 n=1 Tax=Haliotis rufescens TaxID=6454 RepID=UPI00201F729F|nr:uncharacterized protein LOC125378362 [Haliotis rufescens]